MVYSGDDSQDVAGVLADRLAATLVHHEPGWRLPRPSALARRYNVRPNQVEQAVRELAARHLIRQLPDGQLYRASPAEYLISLTGVPRLGAHVDPMGSDVTCRSRKVSWRRAPEDIGAALDITDADTICVIKCHWSVNGDPAAISTTYLTAEAAGRANEPADPPGAPIADWLFSPPAEELNGRGPSAQPGLPVALHLEMQPPPSSVARGLRLRAGQAATMVTVRFDDASTRRPVALSVAALRPDLFRVVIDSPTAASPIRAVVPGDALDEAGAGDNHTQSNATGGDQLAVGEASVTYLKS